jgi:hypothetical protein
VERVRPGLGSDEQNLRSLRTREGKLIGCRGPPYTHRSRREMIRVRICLQAYRWRSMIDQPLSAGSDSTIAQFATSLCSENRDGRTGSRRRPNSEVLQSTRTLRTRCAELVGPPRPVILKMNESLMASSRGFLPLKPDIHRIDGRRKFVDAIIIQYPQRLRARKNAQRPIQRRRVVKVNSQREHLR